MITTADKEIQKTRQPFFAYIQVLRGLAAVMVIIGHAWHEAAYEWGAQSFKYPFGVGVHIFFVISGFVIAYNSPKLCATGWDGIKEFLIRRSIRIIPLYWFFTSLMVIALFIFPQAIGSSKFEIWHVIQSYLFIPHENPGGKIYPVLSLGWTLNYEMYFYAVFMALLILPFRKLTYALSIFFITTVILEKFFIPQDWVILSFWFNPIVLEFLAGVWIGYLKYKGTIWPRWTLWPLTIFGILGLISLYYTTPDNYLTIMGLAGTALIAAAALPKGMEKANAPYILRLIGDSSYSLYLSHAFTLGILTLLWIKFFSSLLNPYIYMVTAIIIAVFVSIIVYIILEKPLTQWLKERAKKGNLP